MRFDKILGAVLPIIAVAAANAGTSGSSRETSRDRTPHKNRPRPSKNTHHSSSAGRAKPYPSNSAEDFGARFSRGLGQAFRDSFGEDFSDSLKGGFKPDAANGFSFDFGKNSTPFDWNIFGEQAVPFADLDISGPAPTKIVAMGPDQIIITQGDKFSVSVDGGSTNDDGLRFLLDDDRLNISRSYSADDGPKGTPKDALATVHITVPNLETLTLTGSSKAQISNITANALTITIAGSGICEAQGAVKQLDLTIAGSGSANLADLKADKANVSIAGSGQAVFASDGDVSANIMGSGRVTVRGKARCKVNGFGSGEVICEPADEPKAQPQKATAKKAAAKKAAPKKRAPRKRTAAKAKSRATPKKSAPKKAAAKKIQPKKTTEKTKRKKTVRKSPKKSD